MVFNDRGATLTRGNELLSRGRMEYDYSIRWLSDRARGRIVPGRERIVELLRRLGNPQVGLRGIHVVGTNGKGSTCAFAVAALAADFHRVGSMPSPHLHDYAERVRVGGRPLTRPQFARLMTEVRYEADPMGSGEDAPTEFEVLTAAALLHFRNVGVDCVVIEAGMGGRDDATSVLNLDVKILTNVALDHEAYLGDSVEKIAENKVGIVRAGDDLIVGDLEPKALAAVRRQISAVGDVALSRLGEEVTVRRTDDGLRICTRQGLRFLPRPALRGEYQYGNLALAVAGVDALAMRLGASPPLEKTWRKVVESIQWPGRFEIEKDAHIGGWSGTVIFDGAHNPHAVAALMTQMEHLASDDLTVVFGAMRDKNIAEMIGLIPASWSIVFTSFEAGGRAASAAELRDSCPERQQTYLADDPWVALEEAANLAGSAGSILVLGSLALIGLAREIVGGRAARDPGRRRLSMPSSSRKLRLKAQ
ncbi:MAG: bifunctional folylpolyglutamate synthase/dihydrofolate synthase [Gordonia polyisoprenivorans]|nr:bifunctional folylpolyglutamate synthase/dihydrofolate synthase [Gordonia polyisoprenivorans]